MTKQNRLNTTTHNKPKKGMGKNLALYSELLLVATIFGLHLFNKKLTDKQVAWTLIGSLCVVLIAYILQIRSSSKLHNNTTTTLLCKDESSNEVFPLAPGQSAYDIDGFKYGNQVYKVCDGTHVCVQTGGMPLSTSLFGSLLNSIKGGLLSSAPDNGWNNLFEYNSYNKQTVS